MATAAEDDTYVPGLSGSCREEDVYPETLQEELNDIMEAFYSVVGENDMLEYQKFVESTSKQSIAEGALDNPNQAPDFELEDQDGEKVNLKSLLEKGPVVLVFYRGKWCPGCNATLMRLQRKAMPLIQEKGATLVAISPMLPDGTQYMSTKRDLLYPVCSDVGNTVARQFKITFEVGPEFREKHLAWGEDIPAHNGDESWEIPLPATYVIDQSGDIVWSFIDNDPFVRCEVDDIVAAIPSATKEGEEKKKDEVPKKKSRKGIASTFKRPSSIKKMFGKKKQKGGEFLANYVGY